MNQLSFVKYLKTSVLDADLFNAWSEYVTIKRLNNLRVYKNTSNTIKHDYYRLDIYGHVFSLNCLGDLINYYSLAEYLEENNCELFNRYKKHIKGVNK